MDLNPTPRDRHESRFRLGSAGAGPALSPGNIHCEVSDRIEAVGYGGMGLVQQLIGRLGLAEAIDDRLCVLRRYLPYRESDHVLSLLLNLLSGGRCLQDVEAKRCDATYLRSLGAQRLPAPSTCGDFLRRFERKDLEDLQEAFDSVRLKVWSGLSRGERSRAILDVDGAMATTQGRCKEGIGLNHEGKWGYMTLLVSLSNTGEVLRTLNRPGNRPSHEGAAEPIGQAAELVRRGGFEQVWVRGDTDFALTRHFDGWDDAGIGFVFGKDAHPGLVRAAEALEESSWKPLRRRARRSGKRRAGKRVRERIVMERGYRNLCLESEHTAEWTYRPVRCKRAYRLVALRKSLSVRQGQQRLFSESRYFFYITNLSPRQASTRQVVRHSNRRCAQEKLIEQMQNGVAALRMPSDGLISNWAWMMIAAQAWNLKAWLGLSLPARWGARKLLRMHFRRFLLELMQIPCQILRRSGRLTFRLLATNAWTPLLTKGCAWLKRHPAPG